MKLGSLVVLAVAVLVPSLSESRIVSKCELKDQLSKAIKLPARLEKHREAILERVTYSVYRRSHLNTSLVRVFGKRITTTTAKPTTEATTPSTSGGNGTATEEMTGPTDIQPATNESVTINPMTTNSGSGTNSPDGSRRKREAYSATEGSGVEEISEGKNEESGGEDKGQGNIEVEEASEEEEEESIEVDEGSEEEGEESIEVDEGSEEEGEESIEEEESSEDKEEGTEEEEEENIEEGEAADEEGEVNIEEEESSEDKEEGPEEEEEELMEEDEGDDMGSNKGRKREKRSFHRRKPKQKEGSKSNEQPRKGPKPKPKPSLKKKWAMKLGRWSLGFYGLFQLSDSYFCDSGYRWSINRCKTSCTAFTDDDISDDIACFVKTQQLWYLVRKVPRYNRAKGFLEDCN